jgi:hypothetical protein
MLRFRYVVLSKRSRGSSTGQVAKASVERPIAVGHLEDNIGFGNEGKTNLTNVSFYSSRLPFGEG